MSEPAPPAAWATALRAALAAGCPVAQRDDLLGNPDGAPKTILYQYTTAEIAPVAQVAPRIGEGHAAAVPPDDATEVDPVEVAERGAIQSEPLLPPLDTIEGRRLAEAQRRMVAGYMAGATMRRGLGPSGRS